MSKQPNFRCLGNVALFLAALTLTVAASLVADDFQASAESVGPTASLTAPRHRMHRQLLAAFKGPVWATPIHVPDFIARAELPRVFQDAVAGGRGPGEEGCAVPRVVVAAATDGVVVLMVLPCRRPAAADAQAREEEEEGAPRILWRSEGNGPIRGTPALTCLRPPATGTPTAAGNVVLVCTTQTARVFALRLSNGRVVWSYHHHRPSWVFTPTVVPGAGHVYVGFREGVLEVLRASNGVPIGYANVSAGVWAAPLIVVDVAESNEPENPTENTTTLTAAAASPPLVVFGVTASAVVRCHEGLALPEPSAEDPHRAVELKRLARRRPSEDDAQRVGNNDDVALRTVASPMPLRWEYDLVPRASHWKQRQGAWVFPSPVLIKIPKSALRAAHADGGNQSSGPLTVPAASNGTLTAVVFGANDGFVRCVSLQSGTLVWKTRVGRSTITATAIVARNWLVIVLASDCTLAALDGWSGDVLWLTPPPGTEGPVSSNKAMECRTSPALVEQLLGGATPPQSANTLRGASLPPAGQRLDGHRFDVVAVATYAGQLLLVQASTGKPAAAATASGSEGAASAKETAVVASFGCKVQSDLLVLAPGQHSSSNKAAAPPPLPTAARLSVIAGCESGEVVRVDVSRLPNVAHFPPSTTPSTVVVAATGPRLLRLPPSQQQQPNQPLGNAAAGVAPPMSSSIGGAEESRDDLFLWGGAILLLLFFALLVALRRQHRRR